MVPRCSLQHIAIAQTTKVGRAIFRKQRMPQDSQSIEKAGGHIRINIAQRTQPGKQEVVQAGRPVFAWIEEFAVGNGFRCV
jgi:hypothetical protein